MKIIKRVGLLVFFSFIGAIVLYLFSLASLNGKYVKWESLGKPPGEATKIVSIGYVQLESGEIYHYVPKPNCDDNCWAKVNDFPPVSEDLFSLDSCGNLPKLDTFKDSLVVCEPWGPGISLTINAIENDGFVYSWNHKLGENNSMFHFFSPIIGAIGGFVIGSIILLVMLFFDLLNWLQKRAQEKDIDTND
ncbi:MAG: hypothetical protein WBB69_10925 [Anaerolineales bacterium]